MQDPLVLLGINLGLLALLLLSYSLVERPSARNAALVWELGMGLAFGLVNLGGVLFPVSLGPSLSLDSLSMGPALSGYFLGPLGAAISVIISQAGRMLHAGSLDVSGLFLASIAAVAGTAFRFLSLERDRKFRVLLLPLLGLVLFMASLVMGHPWSGGLANGLRSPAWFLLLFVFMGGIWFVGILLVLVDHRHDLFRHAQSESRLRQEREAQYLALVNNVPQSMVYQVKTDPEGLERHFLTLSEGIRHLHGLEPGDVMRTSSLLYGTVHPDDIPLLAAKEQEALASRSVFTAEVRFLMPDGRVRWSLIRSAPRVLDDGWVVWDGIETDIDQQKRMIEERDVLMRELYHRTKNTIQEIQSLMVLNALEYRGVPEVQSLVASTTSRLEAIALVQELLYRSKDLTCVGVDLYVGSLVELTMRRSTGSRPPPPVELDVCRESFALDDLVPLGLIINELLTNSRKYAPDAAVHLHLNPVGKGAYSFEYWDEGPGLPPEFDARNATSLGLRLIKTLAEQQLKAVYDPAFRDGPGYSCRMVFRRQDYTEIEGCRESPT